MTNEKKEFEEKYFSLTAENRLIISILVDVLYALVHGSRGGETKNGGEYP